MIALLIDGNYYSKKGSKVLFRCTLFSFPVYSVAFSFRLTQFLLVSDPIIVYSHFFARNKILSFLNSTNICFCVGEV